MRKGYKKEHYDIVHDYFKTWSHDMAYVLGFIVADGNISKNGNCVKIEVKPEDKSVLEFVRDQITPNYELRQSRPSEIRWYPSSSIMKDDLIKLGVIPAKTGKEIIPPNLPTIYLWDFIRGLFDGDGCVLDTNIFITSNSNKILSDLCNEVNLGYVKKSRMNWNWIIENKKEIGVFYDKVYQFGSFCYDRKKIKMQYLLKTPDKEGRYSCDENEFLVQNHLSQTRFEMAMILGRTGLSVKNRLRKLGIRKKA